MGPIIYISVRLPLFPPDRNANSPSKTWNRINVVWNFLIETQSVAGNDSTLCDFSLFLYFQKFRKWVTDRCTSITGTHSGTSGFGDPAGTITGKNFGANQFLVQTPVPLVRFLVRALVRQGKRRFPMAHSLANMSKMNSWDRTGVTHPSFYLFFLISKFWCMGPTGM